MSVAVQKPNVLTYVPPNAKDQDLRTPSADERAPVLQHEAAKLEQLEKAQPIENSRAFQEGSIFRGSNTLYSRSKNDSASDTEKSSSDVDMEDIREAASERDDNITAEEEREEIEAQRILRATGANNYENARATQSLRLPKEILQLYVQAYPIVRRWWVEGAKKTRAVDSVNKRIEALNMQHGRRPELNAFPTTWLLTEIESLRTAIGEYSRTPPKERGQQARKIAIMVHMAMQKLDEAGIPFKAFTPLSVRKQLEDILGQVEASAAGSAVVVNEHFSKPVPEQNMLLQGLATELTHFAKVVTRNESTEAREILRKCGDINEQLAEISALCGLEEERANYTVPLDQLENLLYTNAHPTSKRVQMVEQFADKYLPQHILNSVTVGEGEVESDYPKFTASRLGTGPTLTTSPEVTAHGTSVPRGLTQPVEVAADIAAGHQVLKTNSRTTTRRAEMESAGAIEYTDAAFSLPTYQNGSTHLGKVIGVRRAGFGYRVIVDCGTSNKPHFKIYRGSDFGKGVSSSLSKDFPLKGPGVPVRNRQWSHIKIIRHSITVGCDESSPTYFFVEYKSTPENPYQDQPLKEWLTMSELATICGRKLIKDNIVPKCHAKWNANELFFQDMKVQMRHPDTKEPLTRADKRESLWLFPEDDASSSSDEEATDEKLSDYDTSMDVPVDDTSYV